MSVKHRVVGRALVGACVGALVVVGLLFGVPEVRDAAAQSRCYSNSECGGGVCRSGVCTTAGGRCYSNSECGGGVCRSGTCTTANGACYSDAECPDGVCRSGQCTVVSP